MNKLLIADDEPIIRRGLKKALKWELYDIEVIGEAEDGELALELVKELKPDIIFLDICMPFINGLDLVKRIKAYGSQCKIIIITGHAEFSYAQEAVKLKVDDFLLKPIRKEHLKDVIIRITKEINDNKLEKEKEKWYEEKIKENNHVIKESIINNILNGQLTNSCNSNYSIDKKLDYIEFNRFNYISIIHPIETIKNSNKLNEKLVSFAIKNIIKENIKDSFIFETDRFEFVILFNMKNLNECNKSLVMIEENLEKYLKVVAISESSFLNGGVSNIKVIFEEIRDKIKNKLDKHPIVLNAIKYINKNYFNEDLSLEKASNDLNVNSTYLSKKMKKDLGVSFIEYLINIRINAAINLMEDPTIKLYDVAELVGYKNQHYFSKAFKKVKGISPKEFIQKNN